MTSPRKSNKLADREPRNSIQISNSRNADNRISRHLHEQASSPNRSILSGRSARNSISLSNYGSVTEATSFPEDVVSKHASKVLENYLVQPDENMTSSDANCHSNEEPNARYSASYSLKGGSITRDIYKWHENQNGSVRSRRTLSFSALHPTSSFHDSEAVNDSEYMVEDMLKPGGFRRHYVLQKAAEEGREANIIARSFIDFLALYGHFAGEDYFEDEDDEDSEQGLGPSNSRFDGSNQGMNSREIGESTPLKPSQRNRTNPVGTASAQKCFFLLMKSFVGTGVLFLPRSFYNGGMTFSIITLLLVAVIALYCMLLLVECHHMVGGSFGDIGKRLYGPYARYAVMGSIILSQLGFCCAYTIFVAKTVRELTVSITDCAINLPESYFIFGQLLIYIPMAMVRKIKYFSMAALIADVFILAGLGYLYYFDISKLATQGLANIQSFNKDNFALMIGTAIFTFEGIGLVLPIAESMKEPQKFPKVLSWTVAISAFIFTSVAALCYAAFGDKVDAVVLLNLPRESTTVQSVQGLYSLAIMFSVPLQLFPALRIIETGLFPRGSGKESNVVKWQKNTFRSGLVLFFLSIAFLGSDSLDNFVSMIGAFACVPLCFIYPALFHWKAINSTSSNQIAASPVPISKGAYQNMIDIVLVAFGVIMMVYVSIINIINWSSPESNGPDFCA